MGDAHMWCIAIVYVQISNKMFTNLIASCGEINSQNYLIPIDTLTHFELTVNLLVQNLKIIDHLIVHLVQMLAKDVIVPEHLGSTLSLNITGRW